MQVLASVEVRHSRPGAPTRRLGLGRLELGENEMADAVVLAAMAAMGGSLLDEPDRRACEAVLRQVRDGRRVVQPAARHRYQVDHEGLATSVVQLRGDEASGKVDVDVDGTLDGVQIVLAAVYAAERFEEARRVRLCDAIAAGLAWEGEVGPRFMRMVAGSSVVHDEAWARRVLGVGPEAGEREVQRRFRALVRAAHPDGGGDARTAAGRLAELDEARQVLRRGMALGAGRA
jgi:hypothetical protein